MSISGHSKPQQGMVNVGVASKRTDHSFLPMHEEIRRDPCILAWILLVSYRLSLSYASSRLPHLLCKGIHMSRRFRDLSIALKLNLVQGAVLLAIILAATLATAWHLRQRLDPLCTGARRDWQGGRGIFRRP